jgi:hypothetical protein
MLFVHPLNPINLGTDEIRRKCKCGKSFTPPPQTAPPPRPQTRDSINWWMPLCRWGAGLCNSYKWGWLCGLTLQYCQVSGLVGWGTRAWRQGEGGAF